MLKPIPVEPIFSVTELYTLYYFHHKSGYVFAGESHDFWEIIYVDKGRASGINGTEPYTLERGQLIFHHPNVFHNFRTEDAPDAASPGDECDIIVVSFHGRLAILEQFRDHIFTLSMRERHLLKEMVEEGKKVYDKPFGKNLVYQKGAPWPKREVPGAKQMIRNLLEQLLISLYRKQQDFPAEVQALPMRSLGMEYQIVREVVTFLDQNIYNNITFVDVASHFNLSETQLKKLFREVTGYSVMQYYRKAFVGRIEYHIRQMDKKTSPSSRICSISAPSTTSPSSTSARPATPLRDYLKSSQDTAPRYDILQGRAACALRAQSFGRGPYQERPAAQRLPALSFQRPCFTACPARPAASAPAATPSPGTATAKKWPPAAPRSWRPRAGNRPRAAAAPPRTSPEWAQGSPGIPRPQSAAGSAPCGRPRRARSRWGCPASGRPGPP